MTRRGGEGGSPSGSARPAAALQVELLDAPRFVLQHRRLDPFGNGHEPQPLHGQVVLLLLLPNGERVGQQRHVRVAALPNAHPRLPNLGRKLLLMGEEDRLPPCDRTQQRLLIRERLRHHADGGTGPDLPRSALRRWVWWCFLPSRSRARRRSSAACKRGGSPPAAAVGGVCYDHVGAE
eukprot:CAMPEP_0182532222 /NCGR_PEP_ID=MMETSP1323-20130603/11025_1 /TAXON_ID=236787 /ORGANISM="Florenciella parvula, Strain RCC1693" /LENGTH=178 /DNA_ID=CAMNT_0024741929 /DNA_START=310 /DNA_END=847 /DNA_ORIENTATION=+